ncbi:MAG: hypothetical protein KBT28_01690 [Bacteroidales bacterium]|nr:hypothetical protein [Candidatus Colimorpha merdihippi]
MSNRKDLFKSFTSTSFIDGVKWQIIGDSVFAFIHPVFEYTEDIEAEVAKVYEQFPTVINERYFDVCANLFIVDVFSNRVVVTDTF